MQLTLKQKWETAILINRNTNRRQRQNNRTRGRKRRKEKMRKRENATAKCAKKQSNRSALGEKAEARTTHETTTDPPKTNKISSG